MIKLFSTALVLGILFTVNPIDAYEISAEQKTAYGLLIKNLGHSRHKVRESSQKALKEQILSELKGNMHKLDLKSIKFDFRVLSIAPYEKFFENFKAEHKEALKDPELRLRLKELWEEIEANAAQIRIDGLYLRSDNNKWRVIAYDKESVLGKDLDLLEILKENKVVYVDAVCLAKMDTDLRALNFDDVTFDEFVKIIFPTKTMMKLYEEPQEEILDLRGHALAPLVNFKKTTLELNKIGPAVTALDDKLVGDFYKLSAISFSTSSDETEIWVGR